MSARLSLWVVVSLLATAPAAATRFDQIAESVGGEVERVWNIEGFLRVRETLRYNLDLDHGLTPSGDALFPTPPGDPAAQLLHGADMRLRLDLSAHTLGGGVGVFVRLDLLDNLSLGSTPDGIPSASVSQRPAESALRVKRAYGVALTPLGFLAAGRMGNHWGLGLISHGGDCRDCDGGDASDRIAFITALGGHLWALAYDFTATGPLANRPGGGPAVDVDPTDNVHTVTLAMLKSVSDATRLRRLKADRATVEYGLVLSHRFQDNDAPADYLPVADAEPLQASQVMRRGFRATAVDVWARVTLPWMRLELEGAVLVGAIEQASLIPGVLLDGEVESLQIGVAFESDFGPHDGVIRGGLDAGFASGDPAPGFGVNPQVTDAPPKAGDLDGAQAIPGRDNRVDNFRFHPNYRIDKILFREILGTITDAIYVRPHLRWEIATIGPGTLHFDFAGVMSWAADSASTPGGTQALGIELDPSLEYQTRDGFGIGVDYAVLFPLSGLDNGVAGISAAPAQLTRFWVSYAF
jgi:uncharacterized protein (TIGR04551 family)